MKPMISVFARQRRTLLAIFWLGAAMYFFTTMLRLSIPGNIFNLLQEELGCGANGVVALGTFFMYAYALCQPVGGVLADKYGGCRISLFAALFFSLGTLGFVAGGGLAPMVISRIASGIGAGLVFIGVAKLADDLYKRNFALIMGVLLLISCAGGFVGVTPLIELAERGGWRLPVGIAAAVVVLLTAGEFLLRRRLVLPPPRRVKFSLRPILLTFREPLVARVFGGSAAISAAYAVFVIIVGRKFLEECVGLSPGATRLTLSLMLVVSLVCSVGSGLVSKWCGNRRRGLLIFYCASTLVGVAGVTATVLFDLPGALAAVSLMLISPSGSSFAIFSAASREMNDPEFSGVTIGVLNFCDCLVIALTGNLCGFLLDLYADRAQRIGDALIYPDAAYLNILYILLAVAALGLWCVLSVPETHGNNIWRKK